MSDYRLAPEDKPFGPYTVVSQVRRSDVYEQYEVSVESGIRLSLKSVAAPFAPSKDAISALTQPLSIGLLSVVDLGQVDPGKEVFVVTELAGKTLRDRLAGNSSLPPAEALSHLRDLARSLRVLEDRTIPMPIVIPEAVCMRDDGVLLDDYFLPLLCGGRSLPPNFMLAPYAAPESDQTGWSSSVTLFSLGVVLYEMVTGRHPFDGPVFDVIASIRKEDPSLEALTEEVRPLVARLMDRDPSARLGRVGELFDLLGSGTPTIGAVPDARAEAGPGPAPSAKPAAQGPRLEPLGPNEFGLPEFLRTVDGAKMVLVPSGTFMMGNAEGSDYEKPPVDLTLESFLIDKYPVIWEQFLAMHKGHDKSCIFCQERNKVLPSRFMPTPYASRDAQDRSDIEKNYPRLNEAVSADGGERLPVTYLTWLQMSRYAGSVGAELPSEAEWEYANRAGSTTLYPWGAKFDAERVWYEENSQGAPHPVGEKKPNPWGLYDMNGNVEERCRDRFVKDIYLMVAENGAPREELIEGVTRPSPTYSCRGGSCGSSAKGVASSFRRGANVDSKSETTGFRCVIRRKGAPEWARVAFEGAATPEA